MSTIGIVGMGFVGTAVREGMKHAFDIKWYDKYKKESDEDRVGSQEELLSVCDGPIFVCVPTPMNKDGSCYTGIVEDVVAGFNGLHKEKPVIIVKSTVPPGTVERLNGRYGNANVVFNPEFLREASAVADFKNQDRIIIGGPHEAVAVVKQMYQKAYPHVPTTKTSSTIAEMVKYVTNCFLATKVSFANEIWQICQALGIDYDKVIEYATKDARLGTSHWAVPGPMPNDRTGTLSLGWGGSCFIKDMNSLIYQAKSLGVKPTVMDAVFEKNIEVRPGKDWEVLKGRAVVDAKYD